MKIKTKRKYSAVEVITVILCVLFLPLIILVVLLCGVYRVIRFFERLWLIFQVNKHWFSNGKFVLLVYSNSPNWKEYIESNILPRIISKSVVLNWSEKSTWDWKNKSLEVKIFKHWTNINTYNFQGKKRWVGEEYNPIAIVFDGWKGPKVFKFWKAFRDYKHGKEKTLNDMATELISSIELVGK